MNHRERFSQTPPLAHDRWNPAQSEILCHIRDTLGCDLQHAAGVFEYLRKNGILVFRKPPYRWQGCAYVRELTQAEINADLMAKIRSLEGQLRVALNMHAKLRKQYLAHLDALHPGA